MVIVYSLLAVVGAAGTWWFNIRSAREEQDYLAGWFANPASSSAAVDVIVVAVVVCLFIVVEARRLGMTRWVWLLVPLTFAIAVAFTFPAFLALRERALAGRPRPSGPGAASDGSTPDEVGRVTA